MARERPLAYVPIDPFIFESRKFRRLVALNPKKAPFLELAVIRLLLHAGGCAPDGNLGVLLPTQLKKICGWRGSADQLMADLLESRWLIRNQNREFLIKSWQHFGGKVLKGRSDWRKKKAKQRESSREVTPIVPIDVSGKSPGCPPLKGKGKVNTKGNDPFPALSDQDPDHGFNDTSSPPSGTQITDEKRQRLVSLRGFSDIKRDAVFTRVEVEAMMTDEGWHVQGYGGPKREDNRLRLSNLGPQMGARLLKAAGITRKGPNPNATYFITTLENLRKRAMYPTPEQVRAPNYQPLYHECTPAELAIRRGEPPPESPASNAGDRQRPENDSDKQSGEEDPFGPLRAVFGRPDLVGGT